MPRPSLRCCSKKASSRAPCASSASTDRRSSIAHTRPSRGSWAMARCWHSTVGVVSRKRDGTTRRSLMRSLYGRRRLTGIDVVNDFRRRDMAAGGQGAPLVPVFHATMTEAALALEGVSLPIAILNIGGVSNATWIDRDATGDWRVYASDVGPGNALLDDYMFSISGERFDRDGRFSSMGSPCDSVVDAFLQHEFFAQPAPKSLDRNTFKSTITASLQQMQASCDAAVSPSDVAATITELTARSVAASIASFPAPPTTWFAVDARSCIPPHRVTVTSPTLVGAQVPVRRRQTQRLPSVTAGRQPRSGLSSIGR